MSERDYEAGGGGGKLLKGNCVNFDNVLTVICEKLMILPGLLVKYCTMLRLLFSALHLQHNMHIFTH